MPIYEFKCNQCGNNFEKLVLGNDTVECPSCSGMDLSKMISKCGFVTKSSIPEATAATDTSNSSSACSGCSAASCATCGSK